jgi:hypothetical protein
MVTLTFSMRKKESFANKAQFNMSLKHSQFKNYLKQKIVCRINTTSHRIKATNSYLALVYVCKKYNSI